MPNEVIALLPQSQTGKKDGDKVNPTKPAKTRVETTDGIWTFEGYDKNEKTVEGKNVEFVGTWKFTPKTYKVTHEFKSADPSKKLPKEVKALLPGNQTGKKDGSKVNPTKPAKTRVETTAGTWTFEGYDKNEKTIDGKDAKFVGTWKFTPKTYKVTHEFKSADPSKKLPKEVKALLPVNQTGKKDGSKVNPTKPAKTRVETATGTWTFEGYDKNQKTIDGKDAKFIGTWKFTPKALTPNSKPGANTPSTGDPDSVGIEWMLMIIGLATSMGAVIRRKNKNINN